MIVLRSEQEIEAIRRAGRILREALDDVLKCVRPGLQTKMLDSAARSAILDRGGYPAFKGYKGYPANICTSVNEGVVHGIPSERELKNGDIVSIDIGVRFRQYYADAAVTVGVGRISDTAKDLIAVTERALQIGIANSVPGKRLFDISSEIQRFVEANGYSVVRVFTGHGIGTKIHEEPEIPNYGKAGTGQRLEPGMILAIEPMVNLGAPDVEILDDGWTAVTKDRRLSAHFEHTVAVTKGKAEILTL